MGSSFGQCCSLSSFLEDVLCTSSKPSRIQDGLMVGLPLFATLGTRYSAKRHRSKITSPAEPIAPSVRLQVAEHCLCHFLLTDDTTYIFHFLLLLMLRNLPIKPFGMFDACEEPQIVELDA